MDWIAWPSSGEDLGLRCVLVAFFCVFGLFYFFVFFALLVWLPDALNRTESVQSCPVLFSRADLLGLYEQVILTDIDFSDSQNVDQALWKNVFYQVIEHFRQLLKDPTCDNTPHIRNMLLTLLDEVRNVWEIQKGQSFTK